MGGDKMRGIMIAAPASGSGKTALACGLMELFKERGVPLAAFKCGPDYIDPMFHRQALGVESRNLDSFFLEPERLLELFLETGRRQAGEAGLCLAEGAMGYFDGMGADSAWASSWEVSRILGLPVILVVDARGASLSLLAQIRGFLDYLPEGARAGESLIRGVILNRCSPGVGERLKGRIEGELGVRLLGCVPPLDWLKIESRHLGLKLPGEIEGLKGQLKRLAGELEQRLDVEGILELAAGRERPAAGLGRLEQWKRQTGQGDWNEERAAFGEAQGGAENPGGPATAQGGGLAALECKKAPALLENAGKAGEAESMGAEAVPPEQGGFFPAGRGRAGSAGSFTLGVAMDRAFCFYYRENLEMLEAMGARLAYFSPLADRALPKGTQGLYLGGGYPELWARELAENEAMRRAVFQAARSGMPILGECGGYLYLLERLEGEDGALYPMAGVFEGEGRREKRLRHFGYIGLEARRGLPYLKEGAWVRGHEFHYWHCAADESRALGMAHKPSGKGAWPSLRAEGGAMAGFPHLYYPSQPELPRAFAAACRLWKRGGA